MSKILLHICCAPCALGVIPYLKKRFSRVSCLFFNPNIHPFLEFQKRLHSAKLLAENLKDTDFHFIEEYGLFKFLPAVIRRLERRCEVCYRLRLGFTAKFAKKNTFDSFTTTLLTSKHQNLNLIRQIGRRFEHLFGVKFLDEDLRFLHNASLQEAKHLNLYRQKYCGCIFSEYERFSPHNPTEPPSQVPNLPIS
ncbi:MAG: epoxyqueuosine reductase QueH [Planctomycetota bacterium]|nr:epoxyqueuosine reductase QueH [Planctomycetota bacterium]